MNNRIYRFFIRCTKANVFQKQLPFAVLLLIFFSSKLTAQDYKPVSISLAEGLSQSTVYSITQDSTGFIWIGTQDGLNKYDGTKFKIFRNEPFDSLSVSSGNIMSLLQDYKGRLWCGTAGYGLDLFIPEKDQFRSFHFQSGNKNSLSNNAIVCVTEDVNGNLWIGTDHGLNRGEIKTDAKGKIDLSFTKFFPDTSSAESDYITCIYPEDAKTIWVGTSNGLFKFIFKDTGAKKTPQIIPFFKTDVRDVMTIKISSITKDIFGHLVVGTSEGLEVFDQSKNNFVRVFPAGEKSNSNKNYIRSLLASSSGNLFVGTDDGLFNISKKKLENIFEEKNLFVSVMPEEKSMKGTIRSLFEDRINKGIIWVGTDANGMTKLVPVTKKFHTNHLDYITNVPFVFSIFKDEKKAIWIGTTDGLIRMNMNNMNVSVFHRDKEDKNSLLNNFIAGIEKDSKENYWILTNAGLHKMENPFAENPKFTHIIVNPASPYSITRQIYLDKDSNLYAVLPRKIYKYNYSDNKFNEWYNFQTKDKDLEKTERFSFNAMLLDKSGNLWVGCGMGLLFIDHASIAKNNFSDPQKYFHKMDDTSSMRNHTIFSMKEDSKGNVWLATANGLIRANLVNGKIKFKNYSTHEGLCNNTIYGILEDEKTGSLWMSTNGGLSRFDPSTGKFSNFDLHDGLQSNEFDAGAYFKSSDGEMFFGGVNGYTSFYPEQINADTVKPVVSIIGFKSGDNISMTPEIKNGNKVIELNHNQNSFIIDFIALHYADPLKNQYAYRLEGFQNEWTYNGNIHSVNFSQLAPGNYIFKVIGSNNDGLYNTIGDTLTIIINPPFWKTWWFFLLVVAFCIFCFWLIHLYRLKLRMVQVKEVERIRRETAADFHDELGHRLTTISWFGEIMKKKLNPQEEELRSYLDKIIETSGTLYHTMKDLLWAMDPGKASMYDLYNQLKEFGESLYDQTGVDFSATVVNGDSKKHAVSLSQKRHVLLIFKEAMHNSFKHSQSEKVHLDLTQENNHYTLTLKDNGKGFNMDVNNFGNGLKNVKKRAALIHSDIRIESSTDGTKIELDIPLN